MGKEKRITDRVGTELKMKNGLVATCISYNNANSITVRFHDGLEVHTSWKAFSIGEVKNKNVKTAWGVGFIGEGRYSTVDENNERLHVYVLWRNMLERCYGSRYKDNKAYEGCTVDKDWHNYQNFAKFYYNNFYEVDGERMELDKDISVKGNKIYSNDTCIFVPQRVNSLLIKQRKKNNELPIGVNTDGSRFYAYITIEKKRRGLGGYATPEEAFQAYKAAKEEYIQKVALEYKYKIPARLFVALMNYEVDIND